MSNRPSSIPRYLDTNPGATRIALAVALAASVAASLVIYGQQTASINNLSSQLVEKTQEIDEQRQSIDAYSSLLDGQRTELADLRLQLDTVQSEIGSLSLEIESQANLLSEKNARAASLEQQVSTLQSEIQARDQELSQITLANASTKRVHVTHYGLGVDEDDKGIVFTIEVEIIGSGDGRISVNVSDVQFEAAFQDAIRTAASVASAFTGVTISDKDIIVTLVNDSESLIKADGPSAGAILAVMIAAGLQEKQLDPSVLVTGTIRSDGTIGKVGGLSGKADAAQAFGAEKLLVPRGQEFQDNRIEIEEVGNIGQLASRIISSPNA